MERQVCARLGTQLPSVVLILFCCTLSSVASADTFGTGENLLEIEFASIGQPGNPPDTTDRPVTDGAVPYRYRIGKYEISEELIDKANVLGALGLTHDGRGANFPATSISWFEAARFVNWLNESSGHAAAYKFDAAGSFQLWQPVDPGYNPTNLYRNKFARYFLPSLDEWHKAAYYDPVAGVYYDYPTGSDSVPDGIDFVGDAVFDAVFFDSGNNLGPNVVTDAGLLSPFGTVGQGGNVSEWEETAVDRVNNNALEGRGFRGGNWGFGASVLHAANQNGIVPSVEEHGMGLRVVSIPEPCSLLLLIVGLIAMLSRRTRS